jgi:asparagine synthase (glutamine-hydrolysing)
MCGLTGFFNSRCDESAEQMRAIVGGMARTLHHRGPDDTGVWCDPVAGMALGHKRLSIVDLSPAGHQPMSSHCGRFVTAYNGEIYNHDELRRELAAAGHPFRGRSDTEVLVEGFAAWGIEATLRRCVGMFAIAVWDARERTLILIRDRLGKKPLYYGRFGSVLLFGSELKALRAHPAFAGAIDRDVLAGYLRWCHVRHPGSIYRGVRMLPPGTMVTFSRDDPQPAAPVPFWSFTEVAEAGMSRVQDAEPIPFEQAADRLEEILTGAVACRMMADVPLGAFLSGGIDSSLVVALMQKLSARPVKTFTIGFEEAAYNEAPYAARVASHLKTDHTELYVTSAQARDVIPLLPTMFDEPFADSSQIPTFLVCRMARQHVTVALSGDGGDEVFCGYRRYFEAFEGFDGTPVGDSRFRAGIGRLIQAVRRMPPVAAAPIRALIRGLSRLPVGRAARRFEQLANLLNDASPVDRYLRNLSHWLPETEIVIGAGGHASGIGQPGSFRNLRQAFQWYDTLTYLPDDILTKVDRTSMAVSLEARTPLLDHRVVGFAWALPHEYLVQGTTGKRILREVLSKHVPRSLFERPKVGFGVPIDAWLRGPLRDWAEELLDEGRLRREGYLNPVPIRQKWAEHLGGRGDWHYLLWDVLMFQAWLGNQTSPV